VAPELALILILI